MNTNGLCVVKKLVQSTDNKEEAARLMSRIAENAIELVQNPYGNYAVTEVINVSRSSFRNNCIELGHWNMQTYIYEIEEQTQSTEYLKVFI